MSQSTFKTKEEVYEKPPLQPRIVPNGTEDFTQYRRVPIKDCGDKEEWNGQPFLADIYEGQNKETKEPYWSAAFQIIDHSNKEILRANIYLKGMGDDIKLKEGSAGFELVKSIDAVNGHPTKDNRINMSFEDLQTVIYNYDAVKAIIHEHWNNDRSRSWNTVEITEIIETIPGE